VSGWVMNSHTTLIPLLGIRFYTSGGSTVSTDVQAVDTYTETLTWKAESHAAVAPATAATYSVLVRGYIASGNVAGSIYFDDMNVGAPVMFVQSDRDIGEITVVYTEAYLQ
jgi:hypothetical protein